MNVKVSCLDLGHCLPNALGSRTCLRIVCGWLKTNTWVARLGLAHEAASIFPHPSDFVCSLPRSLTSCACVLVLKCALRSPNCSGWVCGDVAEQVREEEGQGAGKRAAEEWRRRHLLYAQPPRPLWKGMCVHTRHAHMGPNEVLQLQTPCSHALATIFFPSRRVVPLSVVAQGILLCTNDALFPRAIFWRRESFYALMMHPFPAQEFGARNPSMH